MKKPFSELPFKEDFYDIKGNDGNPVAKLEYAGDIDYILDACNNFPKAIELLKESLDFMNLVPNKVYSDNYTLCSKINKLLKELE